MHFSCHFFPSQLKVLRDAEEVDCEAQLDALTRNGLGDNSNFLWPDGIVPYIVDPTFNATNRANIDESVAEFNRIFEGCAKWRPRDGEPAYVEFSNTGSCYARIGRAYWPFPLPQRISIGRCAHLIGHVKHEMMHTMGFYHEHSRSDRDMFVEIHWDNILQDRKDQFLTYRQV